ncbi:MAG: hypothetical protein JNL82_18830 [Myxococcales bacterium]|nr:hypothetical protein [Myxococcales bacterium]
MARPRLFLSLVTLAACSSGSGSDGGFATMSGGAGPTAPADTSDGLPTTGGSAPGGAASAGTSGSISASDGATTSATTDSSTSTDAPAGSTSTTDVPSGSTGGDDGSSGAGTPDLPAPFEVCSKVDVLLVVDASETMTAELATLPATFAAMQETLALEVGDGIEDFNIATINACPKPPNFHNFGADDTDCQFPDGRNWLASDDAMLDQRFACVVQFPPQEEALDEKGGDNGGYNSIPDTCSDDEDEDEQPAWTAARALDPGVAANAGFSRPDAVLFVVAITDEDEALVDPDDADEIRDALVAAKGDPDKVVFLAIGGDEDGCNSAYDDDEVKDSKVLRDVADAFGDRGLFRTMCEKDGDDPIGAAFDAALTTVVDAACTKFVPN